MIDVHCHILPGLDDGVKNLDCALILAIQLSRAGFQKVIATPHVFEGCQSLDPRTILEATNQLNQELKQEGIPLEVLPGAENYICPELPKYLKEEKILTMADSHKYLLLELPVQELPLYTEHVIFELQVQGITPVLAHPERYHYFAEAPELLVKWKDKGVILQVDLRSLDGVYGSGPLRLASWLLENSLVQLIGTDSHRPSHSKDGFERSLQFLSQKVRLKDYVLCLETNPQAILDGKDLEISDEGSQIMSSHSKKQNWSSIKNKIGKILSIYSNRNYKGFSINK